MNPTKIANIQKKVIADIISTMTCHLKVSSYKINILRVFVQRHVIIVVNEKGNFCSIKAINNKKKEAFFARKIFSSDLHEHRKVIFE